MKSKITICLLIYLMWGSSLIAQCPPAITNNIPFPGVIIDIIDFGAVPNDLCSDHAAFQAAAAFFRANGGDGTLTFTPGNYIVGEQTFDVTNNQTYFGGGDWRQDGISPGCPAMVLYRNPFILWECKDLNIIGNGASIQYEDCMFYGRFTADVFDGLTEPTEIYRAINSLCVQGNGNTCNPYGLNYRHASIGSIFHFNNCKNINLSGFTLNGNLENMHIGGLNHNSHILQLSYDGINLSNSADCRIDNVNAINFGRDGLLISGRNAVAPVANLNVTYTGVQVDPLDAGLPPSSQTYIFNNKVSNSVFNYNGRTGVAWTGCAGLEMTNCSMNFNGINIIHSPTRSGLDIEWDGYAPVRCRYGRFQNCKMLHNRNWALATSHRCDGVWDFEFIGCTFKPGEKTWCILPNSRGMTFRNCDIYGAVGPTVFSWPHEMPGTGIPDWDLKFLDSRFHESDNNFSYLGNPLTTQCHTGSHMFNLTHQPSARVHFTRCDFYLECEGRLRMLGRPTTGFPPICGLGINNCSNCPNPSDNYIFMNDCNIYSTGKTYCPTAAIPNELAISFRNTVLNGVDIYYPSSVRGAVGLSYFQNPNTTVVGSPNYNIVPLSPAGHLPCKPLYTNPPITPIVLQACNVPNPLIDYSLCSSKDYCRFYEDDATVGESFGRSILATDDGGFLVAGHMALDQGGYPDVELSITKFDDQSVFDTNTRWGDANGESESAYSICETDMYYFVVGTFNTKETLPLGSDLVLTRFDKASLANPVSFRYDIGLLDRGRAIVEMQDGNLLVVGSTKFLGENDFDGFAIIIDVNGNALDQMVLEETADNYNEYIEGLIRLDGLDEYVLVGNQIKSGVGHPMLIKLTTTVSGQLQFVNDVILYDSQRKLAQAIAQVGTNLYVTGSADPAIPGAVNHDLLLSKFDLNLNYIESHTYRNTASTALERGTDLLHRNEGGIDYLYIAGFRRVGNYLNPTEQDGLVLKIDRNNNYELEEVVRTNDATRREWFSSFDETGVNELTLTGGYQNAANEIETKLTAIDLINGMENCCLEDYPMVKSDYNCSQQNPSSLYPTCEKQAINGVPLNNIMVYPHGNYGSAYVPKTICDGLTPFPMPREATNHESPTEQKLIIFPNPTTGNFTVEVNNPDTDIKAVRIFNLLGKSLYEESVEQEYLNRLELSPPQLVNGVYWVVVELMNHDVITQKISVLR